MLARFADYDLTHGKLAGVLSLDVMALTGESSKSLSKSSTSLRRTNEVLLLCLTAAAAACRSTTDYTTTGWI